MLIKPTTITHLGLVKQLAALLKLCVGLLQLPLLLAQEALLGVRARLVC
jgi:hypothetical protein